MKRFTIRTAAIGLTVAAVCLFPAAVSAAPEEEEESSYVISDYSDTNNTYGMELESWQTALSDSAYYDSSTQQYVYLTEQGNVTSSAFDGMLLCDPVSISAESSVQMLLYKDGEQLSTSDLSAISDSGYYVLQYTDTDGNPQEILSFTIVPQVTGMVNAYTIPNGFAVTEADYNEESLELSREIDMTKDGDYRIVYECQRTGVPYTLELTVDHTAPTLALTAVKDGVAKGPVDLSDLEAGATVSATLDGSTISCGSKLTRSGNYVLTVTDAAGNSSQYEFTIRVYLDSSAFAAVASILAVIAFVIGYMVWQRKRLRVR